MQKTNGWTLSFWEDFSSLRRNVTENVRDLLTKKAVLNKKRANLYISNVNDLVMTGFCQSF